MTEKEWGLRCYTDPPDSLTWCGDDIYDIYTTSDEIALDGSKYRDW
jgi:general secretion pathway protein G